MPDQPPTEYQPTEPVRIYLAISADGRWVAYGREGMTESQGRVLVGAGFARATEVRIHTIELDATPANHVWEGTVP